MTQPIKLHRPQGGMFTMDLPDQRGRVRAQSTGIKVADESSPTYEKVYETWAENAKFFDKDDIFSTTTEEIKSEYGWGNSFDKDVLAIMNKTSELYFRKAGPEGTTQPRKISRGTLREEKENISTSDSHSFNELIFRLSPESSKQANPNGTVIKKYIGLASTL